MAQDGFLAIGNVKLSEIIRDAIKAFSDNKEVLENYNDGKLESFLESYTENIFNRLDDDFSIEEAKFDSLLETYIRKNKSSFGD